MGHRRGRRDLNETAIDQHADVVPGSTTPAQFVYAVLSSRDAWDEIEKAAARGGVIGGSPVLRFFVTQSNIEDSFPLTMETPIVG